jgi:outer membrane protein assembly factor BamC
MKVWQIVISSVMLVLLVGCKSLGLGSKRIDYGAGATQAPALEVPPDLTAPASDERYRVPQGNEESVATFSDYSKGGAAATQGSAGAVLPEVKGVRLERSGTQRWLVINDKPENVWSVVKAFWQENGLTIKSEDQAAGVMETDWAENRANIPQDGVRNVIGKVFDKAYSSGERDQYRVRLERGKDGVSTEVYITHRGMEEILSDDKNTSKWQARPNDPEMEAIMLQRLMARFGGSGPQAAGGAATGTSGQMGVVYLREVDGNKVIVMNDAFDRSWRRVGLAIEHAGLVVEDKDRATGIYFLRPPKAENGWLDKLQFWKDSANTNVRYRVNVKDSGAVCEVSVTSQDGASDNASRQLVDAIYKNLNPGGTATTPASVSVINATGTAGTASLQEVFDGSKIIVVNDAFDKSWRKVGLAIERAGLAVENNDRIMGIYFLRPAKTESSLLDKLQFWNASEDTTLRYRVNVKDGGKACEVSVTDQYGASDDATKQMIGAIYKNINQ